MRFYNKIDQRQDEQSGSALVYILVAIALLAALTASFMRPSSQQTTSQSTFNTVTELNSQVNFIRSAIQECVLTYPAGDIGLIGTDNIPYPINPTSTFLTSPTPADDGDDTTNNDGDLVRHIRCPGNGPTTDHADIFAGSSGKFMPPPANLFYEWEYYNGVDGVFFYTRTDKSDAFLQTALTKLDNQYSECEADVMRPSGADFDMTSTAVGTDPVCPDGETCFRVWMITQGTAVYEAGGEEALAGCP